MPRKSWIKLAQTRRAEIARHVLHPSDARPPVARSSRTQTGEPQSHQSRGNGTLTRWAGSTDDLDPELASFCQRFDLEPQVQDFESDGDGDDAPGPDTDHDPSDGPEISEQSELEHFSAVLQHAQQIAVQLEEEKERSRKRKTPKYYNGKSLRTSYRHKKARLQLAEKGFIGVFEYIDLQNHTGAKRGSNGASDLTQKPSAKERPLPEEEEESSPEDGAMEADTSAAAATSAGMTATSAASTSVTAASTAPTRMTATSTMPARVTAASTTPASTTPTSVTTASVMPTNVTAASATPASASVTALSMTAASTTAARMTLASATPTNVTAPSTIPASAMPTSVTAASATLAPASAMTTSVTAPGATAPNVVATIMTSLNAAAPNTAGMNVDVAVEAMEVEVEVEAATFDAAEDRAVEVVKSHPNGPQDDNWRVSKGVGDDASLKIVERSVEVSSEDVSDNDNGEGLDDHTDNPIHAEARRAINAMLEDLRAEREMGSTGGDPPSAADWALNLWNDCAALRTACVKLADKCKDKSLGVIFRAWIMAMVGVLNLYLDSGLSYTWRNASLVVAKARGQGLTHARNLRKWILDFVQGGHLPLHRGGQARWTDQSNGAVRDDSDDESDDGCVDFSCEIGELRLADNYYDGGNTKLKTWFTGIRRDPLKHARRVVRLFRASDKRKQDFFQHIHDGNKNAWFASKVNGERVCIQVTTKELLRDVKTRWDLTYKMLERLRKL
ncbi:hypothetical protein EDB85DRAFT_1887750 [Lactarius pseudohatsudake]|nr:hypothetical protein EDB85DRAFT_1887750 [Lactarius pseudohatsudake]